MVDLNFGNFITIGAISMAAIIAFQWAIAWMGWTLPAGLAA